MSEIGLKMMGSKNDGVAKSVSLTNEGFINTQLTGNNAIIKEHLQMTWLYSNYTRFIGNDVSSLTSSTALNVDNFTDKFVHIVNTHETPISVDIRIYRNAGVLWEDASLIEEVVSGFTLESGQRKLFSPADFSALGQVFKGIMVKIGRTNAPENGLVDVVFMGGSMPRQMQKAQLISDGGTGGAEQVIINPAGVGTFGVASTDPLTSGTKRTVFSTTRPCIVDGLVWATNDKSNGRLSFNPSRYGTILSDSMDASYEELSPSRLQSAGFAPVEVINFDETLNLYRFKWKKEIYAPEGITIFSENKGATEIKNAVQVLGRYLQ